MINLKRSNSDKVFAGVCGGLGEYLNIDPTVIRIVWMIFGFMSLGSAFLVYLLCILIIPIDDGVIYSEDYNAHNDKIRRNTPLILGLGLIILGSYMLIRIIFPWFSIRIMNILRYWPVSLILLGLYILFNKKD